MRWFTWWFVGCRRRLRLLEAIERRRERAAEREYRRLVFKLEELRDRESDPRLRLRLTNDIGLLRMRSTIRRQLREG